MLNRRVLRIRVFQFLYSYEKTSKHTSNFESYSKNIFSDLEKSIDAIFPLYLELLSLPIHFFKLNSNDKNISKKSIIKKNESNYNISQNKIISVLKNNKIFVNELLKNNITIKNTSDIVKDWYKLLLKDSEFAKYENKKKPSKKEDYQFLRYINTTFIFKIKEVDAYYADKDLFWSEDRLIVKSMIKKTSNLLNSIKLDKFAFAQLSADLSEDKKFANDLYKNVLQSSKYFDSLIGLSSQNWDIERIATIDKILLKMGICEFLDFSNIPVKVTINEYIDIAKKYSTPKSKRFINGVLDVLSKKIKDKIHKTGKGLIDNK